MGKIAGILLVAVFVMLLSACSTRHQVEIKPMEIKPIHITIDVNIRVEKALDDYFSDIDELEDEME
ncbi:MAG: YnbE family lipoprotein [Desulfobulbaceae bacterium]|nr:YnbE family lipoprotein [Desulfobulbaceae bacterium]MCK5544301.1 YnbE family lipoprotein [Desulfobulbaceae bacterium]